ncbi:MAG TPA: ABC transporter substrate-binding protein [Methylomirabilota bacterium]|jgi:peptide/nickel transport system substrate-binding protein|nr:ABC transporter substrate-binding protein [Methylomirabilota bacterium]
MEREGREPRVNRPGLPRREFLRRAGLAGMGVAGGWAWAPGSAMAKATGTLTIAQGADVTSLDPHQTQGTAGRGVMRSFLESLLIRDQDLKVQPWLAKSYAMINPRTWEFKLRDDAVFHNGEKFTAEAVKFSIERFVDPKTRNIYAANLKPVERVEVVDPYTVRLHTALPYPSLIANLTDFLLIASPKAMRETGEEFARKPIGTGPYRFVEWVAGERLVVQAVDRHWTGGPWVERIVWRTITEPAARVTALRTGDADLIANVPPAQVSAVSGGGMQVARTAGLGIMLLILNASKGPLADKRVRQAINYAVNKEKIITGLYGGAARPLNGPFATANEGFDPAAPPPYPYNPDRAKQLLAEAGHAKGFKFTLITPNGRYLNDRQVAEAAAGDLRRIGVEMEVSPLEWGAVIKELQEKRADGFLLMQNNTDTYQILSTCFSSKIKGIPWLHYANPRVDSLLDQVAQEMNEKERIALYKELGKQIVDDAPWIFLHQQDDVYGVRDRVVNWKPKGDQIIYVFGAGVKS